MNCKSYLNLVLDGNRSNLAQIESVQGDGLDSLGGRRCTVAQQPSHLLTHSQLAMRRQHPILVVFPVQGMEITVILRKKLSQRPFLTCVYCPQPACSRDGHFWAIPENRKMKNMKVSFSHRRHTLTTSFDIFVVTYRVTNFLPKLVDILLFSAFQFLNSLIFGYCQSGHIKYVSKKRAWLGLVPSHTRCEFSFYSLFFWPIITDKVARSAESLCNYICTCVWFWKVVHTCETNSFSVRGFSELRRYCVKFLRPLGSQSGVSVWQHTLVG